MATLKPIVFPQPDHYVVTDITANLLAGTIIPYGTPAVFDPGDAKVKPVTKALLNAGAFFLGIALDTYDNTAGTYTATTLRMIYARNCQWICPNTNGSPSISLVGQTATLFDNNTCTPGSGPGDLYLARVDAITADGYTLMIV